MRIELGGSRWGNDAGSVVSKKEKSSPSARENEAACSVLICLDLEALGDPTEKLDKSFFSGCEKTLEPNVQLGINTYNPRGSSN
jgi:hypothetical protein